MLTITKKDSKTWSIERGSELVGSAFKIEDEYIVYIKGTKAGSVPYLSEVKELALKEIHDREAAADFDHCDYCGFDCECEEEPY